MDCPPGIQLLHSLKNSVTGGSSIFVDSYHAAKLLKERHPEDYEILTTTPVTFHYVNDGHHMYYRRPTIVVGEDQNSGQAWNMHVNYAPPFQGPMDHLSAKDAKRFYQAFQRFADVVEDPKLRYELTLQPGQLGNGINPFWRMSSAQLMHVYCSLICQSTCPPWKNRIRSNQW